MMKHIIDIFLVFCFIFCFSLGRTGLDSSLLVAGYLFIYAITHPGYFRKSLYFFSKKYIVRIILWYIIINLWCIFIIAIRGSSDYSFLLTFLHMLFLLILGCLFYIYLDYQGRSNLIVNYIISVFIIQTAIEWLAFTTPPFKEIINITKSQETIEKGLSYGGVRANALAGSDFFGLSAAYGFVFLIFFSIRNTLFINNRIIKALAFLFLITGTFFAGRSGYIGILILVLYLFSHKKKRISYKRFNYQERVLLLAFPIFILALVFYGINLYISNENFRNLFEFTFELFINYSQNKTVEVSSLSSLQENHFPTLELSTFIFGDGIYTTSIGYYKETDVGIMRAILYMGIIGFIMLLIMQVSILKFNNGSERKLKKYIFLLMIVFSFKGEVLVWGQIIVTTIQLYIMQDLFGKENKLN